MLVLTGANGSGKSSLLRIVAGLLRPSSGSVDVAGSLHYLGHGTALRDALTVAENLDFAKAMLSASSAGQPVPLALQRLGMAALATVPVGMLSAGQRHRAALAGLLACGRAIWLMDEPTSALDSEGCGLVEALIEEKRRAGGIVVAATHLPLGGDAERLSLGPDSATLRHGQA